MSPSDENACLEALEALYRDIDAAYASTSCPSSSECCRFGRTGREPHVTSIEMVLVRRAVSRRASRRFPTPAPLHLKMAELPVVADERVCPMMSPDGRCSIYEARPLGCRTFFCDRKTTLSEVRHRELLAFVSRLKQIAVAHDPLGDQGRPFTRALGDAQRGRAGGLVKKSQARSSKSRR